MTVYCSYYYWSFGNVHRMVLCREHGILKIGCSHHEVKRWGVSAKLGPLEGASLNGSITIAVN